MIFRGFKSFLLIVAIVSSDGSLMRLDKVSLKSEGSNGEGRGIFAKSRVEDQRNFFHLFSVPYIICFFAAKGKWPFVPSFMQAQVDQVGRTIFPKSDGFIRNYCRKWIQVKECFRPLLMKPEQPQPTPSPAINTEVITFTVEPKTTPCSCAQRLLAPTQPAPVVFFDKNYIGNVSSETIYNTIEFLESFLPPPPKKLRRRNKIRDRN